MIRNKIDLRYSLGKKGERLAEAVIGVLCRNARDQSLFSVFTVF